MAHEKTTQKSRKPRGFTLIELMIVVTIIGVLASVAIPEFAKFVVRSKQSERNVMSVAIARAVNDYWTNNGRLPGPDPVNLALLPNPPFITDGSKQAFSPTVGNWSDLAWRPDGYMYFRYEVLATVNADGITGTMYVTSKADMDHDGNVGILQAKFSLQDGLWQRDSQGDIDNSFM